jgi:basic membrane protein A
LGLVATAALVAGCGLFSTPPAPTATTPSASVTATPNLGPTSTPSPSPAPTQTNTVATIVLVSAIGESEAGTPSALAWRGVQDAAGRLGASSKLETPTSMAEVTAGVKQAADDGTTVVVTVGPEAAQAVLDNAGDHTATQFFELDQTIRGGAPSNVHGIAFDEAEAGYLAGFVAASVSSSGRIGMVGFTATDVRTTNYANGLRNGATYADPAVEVAVAYANRSKDPQAGRAAVDRLLKGKVDVVLAMSDLTGAGAMRQACARKAGIVALDTDASLVLPEVEPCLLVSVLKRYDVAARDAILSYAAGDPLPAAIMFDVADGGIGLADFHKPVPPGFDDRLAGVMAALRNGPPRPTPAPTLTITTSPKS